MRSAGLAANASFEDWRNAARRLLEDGIEPHDVDWSASGSLFGVSDAPRESAASSIRVSREFLRLAILASLHRDSTRFAVLYRLLWRTQRERHLLEDTIDEDVERVTRMAQAVRRDIHKMKAFVRFRQIVTDGIRWSVAWFEPEHHIVEIAAPFFTKRFANMHWATLTPERSAYWDGTELRFGPGATRSAAPTDDASEDLWRTYYASIFNPARLKVQMMRSQMPKKYWRNLPESELIPGLIAQSQERTLSMLNRQPTHAPTRALRRVVSEKPRSADEPGLNTLEAVRARAMQCRDCPLWKNATQTVFGEGRTRAQIVFVGEQPGDQEDLTGKPFVGPAGKLLDRALIDAGIDRTATYVTNAVKHFKFEPRGKRRIHKKPNEMEIAACHQWLERELQMIKPEVIVALGATAARAVFNRAMAIEKNRGHIVRDERSAAADTDLLVTVHPSYLLRVPDTDRELAYLRFVQDLKLLRKYAKA
ncbi:MAG TPA: UdgX family uracil-DNA binding protein [Steroidobacteraceae bacterium]|nr:UdgX family uracil-DNA binding protein [Steroidobacteraceae bacterium]